MQCTRKDRVAQLDLLDDYRAHVVLELHAPGLAVGGAGGSQRKFLSWRCARCQVHRQVSEPLLELRAPLVRQLLQVAEPAPPRPFEPAARAPRAARPPWPHAALKLVCWLLAFGSSRKIISVSDNNSDETKPRRYFFKSWVRRFLLLPPP